MSQGNRAATSTSSSTAPSIGELEAKYPLYCKALRLLIREGRSLAEIQRTVCWGRLEQLHICLPGRYKSPDYLHTVLQRSPV
jgi:hypothetical protein